MITINIDPFIRVKDTTFVTQELTEDYNSNEIEIIDATSPKNIQPKFYKNFALDIVVETVFDYPYVYITEKTLRPIYCKRPFVVLGVPGTLAFLKQQGFKTFDRIVDEYYDNITDHQKRFDSAVASIRQFVTQPIEKIRQDIDSISDVLEHNFAHANLLEDIEISQLNL